MFELTGKTAIVTGATKGIGYEITMSLADVGANVVVVSRHEADCIGVVKELGSRGHSALANACDISRPEMIDQLVTRAKERFGNIDILVNNAGVAITKAAEDLSLEEWDKVMDINLRGVFMMSQAVGRCMIQQGYGRIINVASMFGLVGSKGILPYLCSKGGVIQMTKGLALEWAKHNIQVNVIAPGYVLTGINEEAMENAEVRNALLNKIPQRRFATAKEIASAAVYFASDEASYMTGSVLTVDGGWTAQ